MVGKLDYSERRRTAVVKTRRPDGIRIKGGLYHDPLGALAVSDLADVRSDERYFIKSDGTLVPVTAHPRRNGGYIFMYSDG